MGKDLHFEIEIDKSQMIFYPNQRLSGIVKLKLHEELKVRGITLRCHGFAHVHWTEQRSAGKSTYTEHFESKETYIDVTQVLFGKAQTGQDSVVLQKGEYTYPYQLQLPASIPSSYEAYIGRVRYTLHAKIDRPWAFDTHAKRTFTVMNLLDLNTIPNVMMPVQAQDQKTLCCLCCESDPISASIWVERAGYVPGEAIKFRSEIINKSDRTMNASYAKLVMQVTYHTPKKSRNVYNVINKLAHGPIQGGGTDAWTNERIHIPPVPPSFLAGCKIIDIKYFVMMTVDPAGIGFDLDVPVEVTIGSIPHIQMAAMYGMQFTPPPLPPMGQASTPGVPSTLYDENYMPTYLPQATFAESALGRVNTADEGDTQHTTGNIDYAPVYAYYNWNKQDPAVNFTVQMNET